MTITAPKLPDVEEGRYLHSKSGNYYQVLGVALDTESLQPMVVYRPLYKHPDGYELFVRPYEVFTESIEIDGVMKLRFVKAA